MNRTITITYWWRSETGDEIKESHIDLLEESAEKRINEMRSEGYRAGELRETIEMDDEDGVEYSGWWKLRITNE